MTPGISLEGRRLIVVGAGSNLGRQIALSAAAAGAELVVAGPHADRLEATAAALPGGAKMVPVDLTDEDSIAGLAAQAGPFDDLVSTAAMRANAPVTELELEAINRAFAGKVIGPLLLVKHLAGQVSETGTFTFFSGVAAWRPSAGRVVMATTNGAISFMVQALAVELSPVRVNAIAPGVIDSGAWDALGERKEAFMRGAAEGNPARRVGTPDDVIQAVLYAITNPFVNGSVLHVDGGGHFA
jgi:NAD(P)-dependent dehydrogenase (short-subunit alcohol dehydrogenase family)